MVESDQQLPAPAWLTNGYLEEVLRRYLADNQVKVLNVHTTAATGKGENYVSVMSRIRISVTTAKDQIPKELSFILKYTQESDPIMSQILGSYDVYNTEMKMYEQILPQLAAVLQEAGDTEKLCAKTLHADYERSAILFEDLAVKKYIMADRKKGMDAIHARMVLKKLSKFHAAAAVLNEKLNGALEQFDHGIMNRHTRALGAMFENLTEEAAKFALNCPQLGSYYYDKLMSFKSHIVEYGTIAYSPNSKHFLTLNHGDFWINNVMFSYDNAGQGERTLKDLLLIDFQFCNWASPAVDLHFFLNTSLEPQLHCDLGEMDKFVQYYHRHLCDNLTKLQYKHEIPTLHEFVIQMEELKILALCAFICHLPVQISDSSEDSDFHSLINQDERSCNHRRTIYENKRLRQILQVLLPQFDSHGIMDVQK